MRYKYGYLRCMLQKLLLSVKLLLDIMHTRCYPQP